MTETDISSTPRQRSVPYPRYPLPKVEEFARAVFAVGPRDCNETTVAKKAGYTSAKNGAFFAMRSTADQFGLIIAKRARISLAEEWIKAFEHEVTYPELIQYARQKAITQPPLYKQLFEAFGEKQVPVDELADIIARDPAYGITQDAAEEAVKVFIKSAQYVGVLDENNYLHRDVADADTEFDDRLRDRNLLRERSGHAVTLKLSPQVSLVRDGNTIAVPGNTEIQEFTLKGGKKAYLILPVPLPTGEKARLKQWLEGMKAHIDLTLEDDSESPSDDMYR